MFLTKTAWNSCIWLLSRQTSSKPTSPYPHSNCSSLTHFLGFLLEFLSLSLWKAKFYNIGTVLAIFDIFKIIIMFLNHKKFILVQQLWRLHVQTCSRFSGGPHGRCRKCIPYLNSWSFIEVEWGQLWISNNVYVRTRTSWEMP